MESSYGRAGLNVPLPVAKPNIKNNYVQHDIFTESVHTGVRRGMRSPFARRMFKGQR